MNTRAQLALSLIVASLLLGVLGDALLRAGPWGVNAPLWIALLLLGAGAVIWRHRVKLDPRVAWPLGGALLAAGGMAWRDSHALKPLDFLATCGLLGLALWRAGGVTLRLGGACEQLWRLAFSTLRAVLGYAPLFFGAPLWEQPAPPTWGRRLRVVVVGLLLALPPLVIFGALFVAADAVFRDLVHRLVDFDLEELVSHAAPVAVIAWLTAGWLIGLAWPDRLTAPKFAVPQMLRLGPGEIGLALGLVNLLFLAFIGIQLRYLFGGTSLVEVTPGLTYAEYARRGFFELTAVAAVAIPGLLLADWLLGDAPRRGYRLQALALVLMLGVVLASAFQRLRLYQAEYGWTELRLYVIAFLGWLALALGWFGITVLRGRREQFAFGPILAGLLVLATLHGLNPDGWIVRRNLEHARNGHVFDAEYAARLSADAFPALTAGWAELDALQRATLAARFQRWSEQDSGDWRRWSWGVAEARRALREARGEWVPAPAPRSGGGLGGLAPD